MVKAWRRGQTNVPTSCHLIFDSVWFMTFYRSIYFSTNGQPAESALPQYAGATGFQYPVVLVGDTTGVRRNTTHDGGTENRAQRAEDAVIFLMDAKDGRVPAVYVERWGLVVKGFTFAGRPPFRIVGSFDACTLGPLRRGPS